jgi:hypothetical protein
MSMPAAKTAAVVGVGLVVLGVALYMVGVPHPAAWLNENVVIKLEWDEAGKKCQVTAPPKVVSKWEREITWEVSSNCTGYTVEIGGFEPVVTIDPSSGGQTIRGKVVEDYSTYTITVRPPAGSPDAPTIIHPQLAVCPEWPCK